MDITRKLRDFITIKRLKIGPITIEKNRLKAPYEVTLKDSKQEVNALIYSYDENVFDISSAENVNLASMMAAQVALNYGLFCKEIVFDGLYDEADRRFIIDKMENTSREIYINKLLLPNKFLKTEYVGLTTEKQAQYTAAKITFVNTMFANLKLEWKYEEKNHDVYAILSSGGKDSLLTYGIMKELGKNVHPVFVNEAGRHWFTALNSYRHYLEIEPNTARVWCNSDRIFSWMLRQLSFIRTDFSKIRADDYPLRLWTVAVFLFGVLPIVHKRGIGRILIGDEYDSTQKVTHEGITHYNGLFDQSKYFDNSLTRYYMKKAWNIFQFSTLRSLSEMLILKILVKRYPELQQQQVSCHAAHEKDGRIYPCGNCEKCRRIVGMLKAMDENPEKCGYSEVQIKNALQNLEQNKVKQIGSDAAHLYYLLLQKKLLAANEHTIKMAKEHDYILKLRFDNERSLITDMPVDIRYKLFELYLKYADGAVILQNRKWNDINILNSSLLKQAYPFETKKVQTAIHADKHNLPTYLWENLTWEEIEERLERVDTAILPCGAIEQHGPHLPVDVDYYDARFLAAKVAEACSDPKPFVLPSIPFGVSYHHEDFKGTISVTNDALSRFVYDIGISLAKNGIKKLIILNGHGDNSPTLNHAAQMINRDAHIFVCVETGETSDEDLYALTETHNDIHAGEIETSTTLAIRPERVKMDKAINQTLTFGSSYLDFTSSRGVSWYVRTKKISESGIMGDPTKASAEKGRKMWEIMIAHLVKFVEEIKKSNVEDLYQKRY